MEPIRSIGENIENYPYFPPTSTAFGINQDQLSQLPLSQTATASIFAPRTEDMNTGFLTYSEDQPGLTSKFLETIILILFLLLNIFKLFSFHHTILIKINVFLNSFFKIIFQILK